MASQKLLASSFFLNPTQNTYNIRLSCATIWKHTEKNTKMCSDLFSYFLYDIAINEIEFFSEKPFNLRLTFFILKFRHL